MNGCTAAIGSLTVAMKATEALSRAGVASRIIKLDPHATKKGCAYGIEYSCDDHKRVRSAFSAAKITVSGYLKGAGGDLI
jgi:hypothetical protein